MGNGSHGIKSTDLFVRGSTVSRNRGNGYVESTQGHIEARASRINNNAGSGIRSQGIDLRKVTVSGNRDGGVSGGWDNFLPYWVRIDRSIIKDNRTSGNGGGLQCSGTCLVTSSRILGNTARGDGGGVHLTSLDDGGNPVLVARDSRIAGNRAGGSGGGIFNDTALGVVLVRTPLGNNQPNGCTGC
jgi:hypothetical protein